MTAPEAATQGDLRSVVLRTMLLDAVAARSATLLQEHGVPCILLKGRAIASWLYPDRPRAYGDVDLLVSPAQRDAAVEVLGTAGFRHWLEGAAPAEYGANELELVGPHGVCIDLHHTLLGVAAPASRCWQVLSRRTEQMPVGGRPLTVLEPAARAMHLALHVAQNGPVDVKAMTDLERGVAGLPPALWREARAVAAQIDALPAFAAGLHALAAGRDLAAQLRLTPPPDVTLRLRTTSAPPAALQIQKLVEAPGLRRRAELIGRKLWPTRAYMVGRVPSAGGGAWRLLTARLRRMAGLPGKFGVAFGSWYRARRSVRALVAENTQVEIEKERT